MSNTDLSDLLTPSGRLNASREQLRMALRRSAGLDLPPAAPGTTPAWVASIVTAARSLPGAEAVIAGLRGWWANHPLRGAAHVAGDAARSIAAPLARKQPLAMMLGALLAGAVLARLRPWRWLPRTLMFAGLLPQIGSRLVAAVPIESWLNAFTTTARRPAEVARTD